MFTLFRNLTKLIELDIYDTNISTLPHSIINLRNIEKITNFKNKTPQQQRYYDWISAKKAYAFDEYVDTTLIKCASKCF